MKKILMAALLLGLAGSGAVEARPRYSGGDISLLPEYDKSKFYSPEGTPVPDFLTYCVDEGMNCMRVRLFVNPEDYNGKEKDPNAKQDIDYIIPICRRIKEAGSALMLDFHYSDTWADPDKQWTPAAWVGMSDSQLNDAIYRHTKESLETLAANGIVPDFIQTGNEISYGMLWGSEGSSSLKKVHASSDANWSRFISLLASAGKACREVCPEAGIVIHTERVMQTWYLESFYSRLSDLDYDIIGLSYYPYFHGKLSVLEEAMAFLEKTFPKKEIMLVETGYPYAWEVPGTNKEVDYPYTEAGQKAFAEDLVELLLRHPACTGVFWWWMEYNAYGAGLSGWYNAPLVNSNSGRITPALPVIASYAGFTEDPEPEPEVYPDFYLLYNDLADWQVPGTKMETAGDGVYTLRNIYMEGKGGGDAWFALTTSESTNWSVINANRYGPPVADTLITLGEPFEAEKKETSWQIACGAYNLLFDFEGMTLTVYPYVEGDDDFTSGVGAVGEESASQAVYYSLQGMRVDNPGNGIYIEVRGKDVRKIRL